MSRFISARLTVTCGKALALAVIAAVVVQQSQAFDTFWHSAATSAATGARGFSKDATNIVQFGDFGPDFFGPLYDSALGERYETAEAKVEANNGALAKVNEFFSYRNGQKNFTVRKMAIFMHFDNLWGELNSNAKFDFLMTRLLKNTQDTIRGAYSDAGLNEGNRKMITLIALGSSLHMVQDFYSHTNWIHNNFESTGLPLVRMPWGKYRAPTFFEAKAKWPEPKDWPIQVQSGIYPPPECDKLPASDPNALTCQSHTHFNHDNSQLVYEHELQAVFHNAGSYPTSTAGVTEHQLFAINTAAGAGMEWISLVEEDPTARKAIEDAKTWDLKAYNPAMLHDLEGGLAASLLMSCVAKKWDGDKPPQARQAQCDAMFKHAPWAAAGAVIPGMSGVIPTPYNEFWAVHTNYDVIEHLTRGFGDQSGHYRFTK